MQHAMTRRLPTSGPIHYTPPLVFFLETRRLISQLTEVSLTSKMLTRNMKYGGCQDRRNGNSDFCPSADDSFLDLSPLCSSSWRHSQTGRFSGEISCTSISAAPSLASIWPAHWSTQRLQWTLMASSHQHSSPWMNCPVVTYIFYFGQDE